MKLKTYLAPVILFSAPVRAIPRGILKQQGIEQSVQNVDTIIAALESAKVIPNVLPKYFEPTVALELIYTAAHKTVDLGNTIAPANTSSRPVLQISPLYGRWTPTPTRSANKTLILVLSDPDATSRSDPVKGQMCHWIAAGIGPFETNVRTSAPQQLELRSFEPTESGDDVHELMKYMQPAPPPKTGKHRYVFVLLEPEGDKNYERKLKAPKTRPRWGFKKQGKGVMEWAKKNHLAPIGANFFYAQNEEQ